MPARHQIKSKPPREAPQPANGHKEQFESIRAFNRADPSPELNQTQAGRQAGRQAGSRGPPPEPDDRYQNQTTVARTRRPLPERTNVPEPDDRYQNQTTAVQTTSQRTPRTIQSIDRSN